MKTTQLGAPLLPIPTNSSTTVYDPSTSGLTSTDVQDAIDELQAEIDALLPPLTNFLTNTYGEQATLITVSASGATYTIDCSLGNTFDITLTANCVLSISNPAPSGVDSHIVVILRQGGSGSYTVTWPGSVVWQDPTDGTTGGSAPTLWTAVGAQNDVELSTLDGGTTWGGTSLGSGGIPATTVTDETTWGITPAVGTDIEYARQDHTHGSPPDPGSGFHPILVIDTPAGSPLVFADLLQNDAGTDLLYAD